MDVKIQKIATNGILTKTNTPLGGYCANPYVGCPHGCKYCYASFMKRFTNHPEKWGTFLDVKEWDNITNIRKYSGQSILIGSVTDPYNPFEEKYQRTRALLEELVQIDCKLMILTKSDLVLRDLDLLTKMKNVTVGLSINTLDENFKNDMDDAPSIKRRLDAMRKLYRAGLRVVCFISPIFPGITDVQAIVEKVKDQCDLIWLENLNLRGDYKQVILKYIATHHADKVQLYDAIYNKNDRTYWQQLSDQMQKYATDNGHPFADNVTPAGRGVKGHPTIVNYLYHEEVRGSGNTGLRNKKGQ